MWTGDSLTVIEWLGAAVIASVIGAICAPTEGRAKILWGFAAAFALAAFGWVVAPTATGAFATIRPAIAGLVKSNAIATVFIVGVVGLMVGPRTRRVQIGHFETVSEPEPERLPRFAVSATTKWKPDITFRQGIGYLGAKSKWQYKYGPNTVSNTTEELISALAANKITGWGRDHPNEGGLFQIDRYFWNSAEVTTDTDYVFSGYRDVGAYDVHLCQKEMEQVWPPKDEKAD